MAEVLPIETPTLGDRSYLAHDGEVAVVIDPQRDTDRITALAGQEGVRITHVAETHIHNDYISGGLALSRATGAAYLVNGADPVRFARQPVADGDVIQVSPAIQLRVVATPGHTFTHLSYVLESAGQVAGVFTGGSLLFGSTGRPDLLGPENTGRLARAQHASARRLAGELPDSAQVFPTHGFGSFCAATQTHAAASTVGREKQVNPALTLGEDAYVEALLAGLDAYPAYYAHMGPANLAGSGQADLSPPRHADPAEIRRRISAGEWVVDLRDRVAFAAGFVPGTFCFSLDGSFASYLGWVLPWGTPLTLLGETPQQVAQAQRELARIGIDRPAAAAAGQPGRWSGGQPLATLRLARFGDLATAGQQDAVVLDVRRELEWAGGHVAGAVHIPFNELPRRAGEIPPGEVWIYCRTGYRSTVAASILAAAGRQVISIDDEFDHAEAAGLTLTRNDDGQSKGDHAMSAPAAEHHTIVVVGGGTAGITTAARLIRAGQHDIAVIEPSSQHFYQPLFTVVGGGRAPQSATVRPESDVMPKGVRWIREAAVATDPDAHTVSTESGRVVGYDYLVMAPGIQLDFGKVPGLTETLGENGVSSNYRFDLTPRTWEFIRDLRGGTAIFTMPAGPIKCAGAPQKIAYLAADWWRSQRVLDKTRVILVLPTAVMFSQPDWAKVLEGIAAGYGIEVRRESQLTEVDGEARRAVIADTKAGTKETIDFDLLHAVPPQSAPDWVKHSPLADPAVPAGYVSADKHTLTHPRWPNVFTLGDAANLPTSKTGAAVRKQAPVLVANLTAAMRGQPGTARYDGYTSCPLVTSRNRMLLAEFDYDLKPRPSIPLIDTMKPRYDMWLLKRYGLPALYWNLMLRGRA